MNKKGFTLVELIAVILIIGAIATITVPNVTKMINHNRVEGAKSLEKLLARDLELYNVDNEEDLWQSNNYTCIKVDFETLKELNQDINLGNCLFTDNALIIKKVSINKYEYLVNIACGNDLKSVDGYTLDNDYDQSKIYYQSTNDYNDCTFK